MSTDLRSALSYLGRDRSGLHLSSTTHADLVDLALYSRFKYGDGLASMIYGSAMADLVLPTLPLDVRVLVTSSGFGFIPPAAHSLVASFVGEMRQEVGGSVEEFRVLRSTVSNGDYASMSLHERQAAMSHHALSVDPSANLEDAYVVALDDVRVTGVHEQAMDACLRAAGAKTVHHVYVVDAWEVRQDPGIEALLNASAIQSTDDLLTLAKAPYFMPNARFCKRVISMSPAEMYRFLDQAPASLVEWIGNAIDVDDLTQYNAYAAGCNVFQSYRQKVTVATS